MNKLKTLIALCLFSYADLSAQEKDSIDHSIVLNYRITSYFDKYPLKGNTVKLQGPSLAIAIRKQNRVHIIELFNIKFDRSDKLQQHVLQYGVGLKYTSMWRMYSKHKLRVFIGLSGLINAYRTEKTYRNWTANKYIDKHSFRLEAVINARYHITQRLFIDLKLPLTIYKIEYYWERPENNTVNIITELPNGYGSQSIGSHEFQTMFGLGLKL